VDVLILIKDGYVWLPMSGNQMERVLVIANSLGQAYPSASTIGQQPAASHSLPNPFGVRTFDLVCLWDMS